MRNQVSVPSFFTDFVSLSRMGLPVANTYLSSATEINANWCGYNSKSVLPNTSSSLLAPMYASSVLLMSVFLIQAYSRGRALQQAVGINCLTNLIADAEKEIANERSQTAIRLTGSPSLDRDRIDIKQLRAKTDTALVSATRELSRL